MSNITYRELYIDQDRFIESNGSTIAFGLEIIVQQTVPSTPATSTVADGRFEIRFVINFF